ncbi:MAG: hypothetical protein IJY05_04945 [Clostridia bacterium]|nr:hypothetical protein [Clostridia bacterium]
MKKVVKFLPLISAVVGVLALLSLFLPVFTTTALSGELKEFPGLAVLIGHTKELAPGMKARLLDFSFMWLLTYLLTLVGVVFAALSFVKKNSIFVWVAVACFLLAGIFYFMPAVFAQQGEGWLLAFPGKVKKVADLGAGAIVAGICSLLGAAGMVAYKFLNK